MQKGYEGWTGSSARFYWKYSASYLKKKKGFGMALNKKMGETVVKYATPYTPMKTGLMRKAYYVRAYDTYARITYTTSYAKRQHGYHAKHYTTPGTGPYWDRNAWRYHKREIIREVDAYRKTISK